MKNKKLKLIVIIFLGMFGVHKFIEKDKTMGWIYLFTCGLCGIGWIIDIVKCIIDIINESNSSIKYISISEKSQHIYEEILTIHTELNKSDFTLIEKKNLYEKILSLLNEIDRNDFLKITKKKSASERYGIKTPFGWYSDINKINVEFLINTYNQKLAKNNTYLDNLNAFNEMMRKPKEHKIIISSNKVEKQNLSELNDIKISNITKSYNKSQMIKYVVIDVETTGLKSQTDNIIELSAIKIVDGEPYEYFSTLIKPSQSIPTEATNINHITNEMVSNSPSIESVIEDFDEFIKDCNIVGHNVAFDLKFLYCNGSNVLNQKGIKIYDTLELSKKVFKDRDNYKLDNICKENLQIIRDDSHRSLSDAFTTYYLFEICIDLITSNE